MRCTLLFIIHIVTRMRFKQASKRKRASTLMYDAGIIITMLFFFYYFWLWVSIVHSITFFSFSFIYWYSLYFIFGHLSFERARPHFNTLPKYNIVLDFCFWKRTNCLCLLLTRPFRKSTTIRYLFIIIMGILLANIFEFLTPFFQLNSILFGG